MGEVLKFDRKRKEIPVELTGESGPEKYTLREFVGKDRNDFLNFLGERTDIKDGEVQGMREVGSIQSKLISMCLFDSKGEAVSEEVILETFGSSVIDGLFEAAQKLNSLDKEAEVKAKND